MIKGLLSLITRRKYNRFKRQLNENATSRAVINIVCSGALSVPPGNPSEHREIVVKPFELTHWGR